MRADAAIKPALGTASYYCKFVLISLQCVLVLLHTFPLIRADAAIKPASGAAAFNYLLNIYG